MSTKKVLQLFGIGAALSLCFASLARPSDDAPATTRTDAAIEAEAFFWEVFNGGEYEKIPTLQEVMTAAYLADPTDAVTAAQLGWTYSWHITEQLRLDEIPPTITNDLVLARKFFDRAVHFNPTDARYLSGLAATTIGEGLIHQQPRLVKRGYQIMNEAIRDFPEFNLFTHGFVSSRQPSDSRIFKKGLKNLWKNVDVCIGEKFDRINPDMTPLYASGHDRGPEAGVLEWGMDRAA